MPQCSCKPGNTVTPTPRTRRASWAGGGWGGSPNLLPFRTPTPPAARRGAARRNQPPPGGQNFRDRRAKWGALPWAGTPHPPTNSSVTPSPPPARGPRKPAAACLGCPVLGPSAAPGLQASGLAPTPRHFSPRRAPQRSPSRRLAAAPRTCLLPCASPAPRRRLYLHSPPAAIFLAAKL